MSECMIHHACCMAGLRVFLAVKGGLAGEPEVRERRRFDVSWRFLKSDVEGAEKPGFTTGSVTVTVSWCMPASIGMDQPTLWW